MAVVVKGKDEKREKLLRLLTYEVVDGRPIYYRGYREVLEGKKQPEEVMGSITPQARLIVTIIKVLREVGWGDSYASVGPTLAVEVDVKAEVEGSTFLEYAIRKVVKA